MNFYSVGYSPIPYFSFVESSINLFRFWRPEPPPAPDSTFYDTCLSEVIFWQFTRRLSKEEKKVINDKFESSDYFSSMEDIHYKFKEFESGDVSSFKDLDESAYQGLYGVKVGLVNYETFATFLIYRTAQLDYEEVEMVPLFHEGKVNPRAQEIIKQGQKANGADLITDEELKLFYEQMKRKPKSAQMLLLGKNKFSGSTIRDTIYQLGYNVLNFFQDDWTQNISEALHDLHTKETSHLLKKYPNGHTHILERLANRKIPPKKEIIASFEIMQTMINIRSKGPYRLIPVLGLSTESQIQDNMLFSNRDMAFNFSGVFLPKEADGYKAYGHSFTYHDFAHAFVSRTIPPHYKLGYNLLYRVAKLYQKSGLVKDEKEFDEFVSNLLDTQFILYLKEEASIETFWRALPPLKDTGFYRFAADFIKKHQLEFDFVPTESLPEYHQYWV